MNLSPSGVTSLCVRHIPTTKWHRCWAGALGVDRTYHGFSDVVRIFANRVCSKGQLVELAYKLEGLNAWYARLIPCRTLTCISCQSRDGC